jgi:hypothetical protein
MSQRLGEREFTRQARNGKWKMVNGKWLIENGK